jgi:hypothetical protein
MDSFPFFHVSPQFMSCSAVVFPVSFADIVPAKGELLPEGVARLAEAFFQDGEITDVWLAMCCEQRLYIYILLLLLLFYFYLYYYIYIYYYIILFYFILFFVYIRYIIVHIIISYFIFKIYYSACYHII